MVLFGVSTTIQVLPDYPDYQENLVTLKIGIKAWPSHAVPIRE